MLAACVKGSNSSAPSNREFACACSLRMAFECAPWRLHLQHASASVMLCHVIYHVLDVTRHAQLQLQHTSTFCVLAAHSVINTRYVRIGILQPPAYRGGCCHQDPGSNIEAQINVLGVSCVSISASPPRRALFARRPPRATSQARAHSPV